MTRSHAASKEQSKNLNLDLSQLELKLLIIQILPKSCIRTIFFIHVKSKWEKCLHLDERVYTYIRGIYLVPNYHVQLCMFLPVERSQF